MKYTLFFFFAFLCIIELNALNLRPKSPTKITTQSRNNVHTKKETSNKEIKGKNEPNKPSSSTKKSTDIIKKTKDKIKEKIKDIIPKITGPKTKTTGPTIKTTGPTIKTTGPTIKTTGPTIKTTGPTIKTTDPRTKITDLERKKIIDKIKEKLKEKIKNPITESEIKKVIDKMKEKIKHSITDQEIKKIIEDLKKKQTHPINTDPTMKKIIIELKKKRPITDPEIKKLIEDVKRKHNISDPEMKKIINDLKRRMKNPVVKSTVPVKQTTLPVKQTTLPNNKNKESTQKIIDFLKSKKGCGYAFGSDGQTLTPELLSYYKRTFGNNVKDSTSKWMNKECYDCSGLTMKALKEVGINVHHNAQATWKNDLKQKGDISTIPNDKLCLVFKKSKNGEMHHIGIYIGNGKVIEAKGADYGVVETDLKGGNWSNWGIPAGLE